MLSHWDQKLVHLVSVLNDKTVPCTQPMISICWILKKKMLKYACHSWARDSKTKTVNLTGCLGQQQQGCSLEKSLKKSPPWACQPWACLLSRIGTQENKNCYMERWEQWLPSTSLHPHTLPTRNWGDRRAISLLSGDHTCLLQISCGNLKRLVRN